MLLLPLLPR
ncbi:hypothetical protein YPPY02_0905, partial [Yersinia pestis PY-02]